MMRSICMQCLWMCCTELQYWELVTVFLNSRSDSEISFNLKGRGAKQYDQVNPIAFRVGAAILMQVKTLIPHDQSWILAMWGHLLGAFNPENDDRIHMNLS